MRLKRLGLDKQTIRLIRRGGLWSVRDVAALDLRAKFEIAGIPRQELKAIKNRAVKLFIKRGRRVPPAVPSFYALPGGWKYRFYAKRYSPRKRFGWI